MTDRVADAYQALDDAVRAVMAAVDEANGSEHGWLVSHYAVIVGQQRHAEGGLDSAVSMLTPHGGPMNYATRGMLAEAVELVTVWADD